MIPSGVWSDWLNIIGSVINMALSNSITSFVFGSLAVTIVADLIYRIGGKPGSNE